METEIKKYTLNPNSISDINYELIMYDLLYEDKSKHSILSINFKGIYKAGSEGNNDALFMRGIIAMAINLWITEGLVLDFTQLSYEWGNTLLKIFDPIELYLENKSLVCYVLANKKNKKSISDILNLGREQGIDSSILCDTIENVFTRFKSKLPVWR